MSETDELQEHLNKTSNQLSEHFDSVLILASRMSPNGGTIIHTSGSGNFYARIGMAKEFVDLDVARSHHRINNPEE